jgi:hypothetical protein
MTEQAKEKAAAVDEFDRLYSNWLARGGDSGDGEPAVLDREGQGCAEIGAPAYVPFADTGLKLNLEICGKALNPVSDTASHICTNNTCC